MPVTSTPAFAQSIIADGVRIFPYDYTNIKTVFCSGANGALIDFIHVGSSDTSSKDLQFWITSQNDEFARGTLTSNGTNVSNNDTVTIGTKTYTFQTTLTNVDGNVKIGSTAALSLTNLINAITGNLGVPGTDYALSMTEHPTVTAASVSSNVVQIIANTPGTAANSIETTKVAATLTWGASTLTGGADNVLIDYLLATVSIPANSGFTSGVGLVSVLDNARLGYTSAPTGLQILDPNGNKLLRLKANECLRVKALTAVTSGKIIWVRVSGGSL